MTDTFTWRVNNDSEGTGQLATYRAQFGDGYSQEQARGLNNDSQNWNVNVAGYASQIAPILEFIRDHAGESFFWTPPLSEQGYFTCKTYRTREMGGSLFVLSMTFEQVFRP